MGTPSIRRVLKRFIASNADSIIRVFRTTIRSLSLPESCAPCRTWLLRALLPQFRAFTNGLRWDIGTVGLPTRLGFLRPNRFPCPPLALSSTVLTPFGSLVAGEYRFGVRCEHYCQQEQPPKNRTQPLRSLRTARYGVFQCPTRMRA